MTRLSLPLHFSLTLGLPAGWIALIMFTLAGCSSTRTLPGDRLVKSYDWESRPFHPEFLIYHHTVDSSQIWLKINSSELLYARRNPDAEFEGRLACEVRIQKYTETGFVEADTMSFRMTDANPDRSGRVIVKKHFFALDTGAVYRFLITSTDLNRRVEDFTTLEVIKANFPTREDYLIFRNDQDLPLFKDDVHAGDQLKFTTARGETLLRYLYWDPDLRLPPPPFTETVPTTSSMPPTQGTGFIVGGLPIAASGPLLTVTNTTGFHVFTLRVHTETYPRVETLSTMIESLRYISSRREYEKIEGSRYPKKELDAFWLDCGGTKDRTRELIRIYYGRVEEANYYFSSFTEGWRTDRGLVHVVFGNPNRIRSSGNYETWIYGEENHVSAVVFTFMRINTPISRNHYILERNALYRTDWDRAVTAWRNGRIFQE